MPDGLSDADVWGTPAAAMPPIAADGVGAFQIFPHAGAPFTDQSGQTYTPDPTDPTFYVDKSGKRYETTSGTGGVSDKSGGLTDADVWGSQAPPAPTDVPVTALGVAKAAGSGALQGLAGLIDLGSVAGGDQDTAARMAQGVQGWLDQRFGNETAAQVTADSAKARDAFGSTASEDLTDSGILHAPQNLAERIANVGGQFAGGALAGPEGDVGALANLGIRASHVALPAASSMAAQEGAKALGAGEQDQQLAALVGGAVGGMGIPGVRALQGVADPFIANISPKAAEAQGGRVLANSATDLPSARSALAAIPTLHGSPQTIGDVTGDLGLIGLSRKTATQNPGTYAEMTGKQAAARQGAISSIQEGADPQAVANHVKGTFDRMDAQTQADVDAKLSAAQAKSSAVGGGGNVEGYGAQVRAAVTEAETAEKARVGALYRAIDPDGKVTFPTAPVTAGVKEIQAGFPNTVTLDPTESLLFQKAGTLPPTAPLRDLMDLRSQVSTAMRAELKAAGRSPTYARLTQLRGVLDAPLQSAIAETPGAAARLQEWENGQQSSNVGEGSNRAVAQAGAPLQSGAGGTALPEGRGPGGGARTAGVSPDLKPIVMDKQVVGYTTPEGKTISTAQAVSYRPSEATPASTAPTTTPLDAETTGRIQTANAAYKDYKGRFGQAPVSNVTASAGNVDQFRLPDGSVPSKFFTPGATGYGNMQRLYAAVGQDAAGPIITDYAASTLRKEAMNPDGTIDPAKFARWQAKYGDALRAVPDDARAGFQDAATASQTVADAMIARADALKAAQQGAVGKTMGAQTPDAVTNQIGTVLRGATRVADMQALVDATKGNPNAAAGLRQAVVDHVMNNFVSNAEAGTSGVAKMRADAYQTFMRTARPALAKVLKPDEIDRLDAVARDIQESQRTLNATKLAGQSNTAQDFASGSVASRTAQVLTHTVLDTIGSVLGSHLGTGGLGQAAGIAGSEMLQALRSAGIAKVNDLVTRAVFDPRVANVLLAKVNGPMTPKSLQGASLLRALALPVAHATQPTSKVRPVPITLRAVLPQSAGSSRALQGVY